MKTRLIGAALIAAGIFTAALSGLAQSAQVGGQGNEFHQTYDLSPNGAVSINNLSGNIRVTTWNENRVKVDAVKQGRRGDDPGQVEIQVTANPDRVEIRTIYPRGRSNSLTVDYDLKVPRGAALSPIITTSGDITVTGPVARVIARSTSGNVSARDVAETATLSSTSGNVQAEKIGGELRTNSTSGNVTVNDAGSRFFAQSSNGNITAIQVRDDATVNAVGGNVKLERIGGRAIARSMSGSVIINDVGGDVQAENASDNVSVTNVKGRVAAATLSGGIIIKKVGEGVRASAISGRVEIYDATGRIEVTTVSDNIILGNLDCKDIVARTTSGNVQFSGRLHDDGHYDFETHSGNVTIIIPPESNFTLITKSHNGSVNTEFPLQLGRGGTVRTQGYMSGVVGKGGAEVRAASFSGNVFIKKAAR